MLRGHKKAEELQGLIGKRKLSDTKFLELACGDGMVSCALQLKGKNATAIDIHSGGFDCRAKGAGVEFLEMDATDLKFENDSFDVVFSYAAFEHFSEPECVLQEAIRELKKRGSIYLNFGPLYMSPFGLHVYRSIPVPYCQFLFSPYTLLKFAEKMGVNPPNFESLNNWSLTDYRELWDRYSHKLHRVQYFERLNVSHLDLIYQYPFCFKSVAKNFDDLIVAEIEVLFTKK
jgi:ubiquinone/menaquinone biosynthesis C-methylase UbiE